MNEEYEHQFVRSNPKMLRNFFGTDDIMSLWIADMEFPVAKPITDELQRLVDRGVYAYELANEDEYSAIADWYQERHQLQLDKSGFLLVSGVLTGIAVLVRELTAPGDGVLIQTPVYHQFASLIKGAGRRVVRNPMKITNGTYKMDLEDLEANFRSENVKLMLLCNPQNPVGRVWTRSELRDLVACANKYQVTIISDEIHGDIIHAGHQFNSLMTVDRENHIAMLGAPSKTFGMQSISHGYIYLPHPDRRASIKAVVDSMYLNHGNALTSFATIAAYRHGAAWLDDLLAYLQQTIAWITDFLEREMLKVKMFPVEGTYQVWLDFRELGLDEAGLMALVVGQAKLGLTPGSWFDQGSALFMRMNIAVPLPKIQTALKQLQKAYHENL